VCFVATLQAYNYIDCYIYRPVPISNCVHYNALNRFFFMYGYSMHCLGWRSVPERLTGGLKHCLNDYILYAISIEPVNKLAIKQLQVKNIAVVVLCYIHCNVH